MSREPAGVGAVAPLRAGGAGGSERGARWWPFVTRTAWVGAAVCILLVVLLDPSVAERWLSADASLERASRTLLRTVQAALAAAGVLLVELGRRFRQHSARKERLVLGLLFAAAAIIVSIVLCEAGLRAASTIRPLTAERHFFFLHDEVLGWRHRPGAVARFKNAVVRINSLGLRGVEIATRAPLAWEEERCPTDLLREMGALGLLGMLIPEEWGGIGMSTVGFVAAMEQIGHADQSVAAAWQAHVTIGSLPLYLFGVFMVRSIVWNVSLLGLLMMGWAVLF